MHAPCPVMPLSGSSVWFEELAVTLSVPDPVMEKVTVPLAPAATVTSASPISVGAGGVELSDEL
ncbi:MAG: hypothetical protein ACRESG_06035, partial [Gammaproteobacteria bacterium]